MRTAAFLYVVLVLAATLLLPRPLGHDEAQYAMGGRLLVEGGDANPYPAHRSMGMQLVAAPGVLLGGGDGAMRLALIPVALAFAAAVAALARRAFGAAAGGWALALQATSAPWLWRSSELLSDMPAAAAMLGMALLIVDDAARPRARPWAWVAVGLLAGAACTVRYGSVPVVAAILGVAVVVYPGRRAWLALGVAAALAALAPLLVLSARASGSPLGLFRAGHALAQRAYPGEGLWYYATHWPWALAGPVMGAALAVGAVACARAWWPGGAGDDAGRARRFLGACAAVQIVAIGWVSHGEPRFVFFASSALAVVGAGWLAGRGARVRQGALVLVGLSALAAPVELYLRAGAANAARAPLVAASRRVRAEAAGRRCLVFTGSPPQVAWASRCRTQLVGGEPPSAALADGFDATFLVSAAGERWRPPGGDALSSPELVWREVVCEPSFCVWRGGPPGP